MAPLADNLARLRKARGLSQQQLAERVGVRQNTIASIESGNTRRTKFLPQIAAVLGVKISDLDPEIELHDVGAGVVLPKVDLTGDKDLPVYASAEGGRGQMIVHFDPIDWVKRPTPLANVQRAYGIMITGDSMNPELRHGDIALIHPHLATIPDETYVFYAQDHTGDALARVKFLVRFTSSEWIVRQWNPPPGEKPDFRMSRKDWPRCHRVVGKFSRR